MAPRIAVLCLVCLASSALAIAQPTAGSDPPPPTSVPSAITPEQALRTARERFDAGQKAEALEYVKSVLKVLPNHTEANVLAGEILVATNDFNSARDHFKKALEMEPSNFKANLGLGKIWIGNRYWRLAASFLEAAEKVAPQASRSEVKRLLAAAYAEIGQTQKGINKAQDAVQADPDDLDALHILAQIRQTAAGHDPQQLEPALADAEKFVQKAAQAVTQKPWERETLLRLDKAYELKHGVLQTYHNSFYQRDVRNAPTGRLLPGKGPDAATVLIRVAETLRARALLRLILSEHDALLLAQTAVDDQYDARNVKNLEYLAASYQQLQELTARLVGGDVYTDKTLSERTIDTYRKVLELDPQNQEALQYLRDAGAPLTTQPAPSADSTD